MISFPPQAIALADAAVGSISLGVESAEEFRPSNSLLLKLDGIAAGSDFLGRVVLQAGRSAHALNAYLFEGPHGGGEPIRIAFFAGIHGDEPSGSLALVKFAEALVGDPSLAEG